MLGVQNNFIWQRSIVPRLRPFVKNNTGGSLVKAMPHRATRLRFTAVTRNEYGVYNLDSVLWGTQCGEEDQFDVDIVGPATHSATFSSWQIPFRQLQAGIFCSTHGTFVHPYPTIALLETTECSFSASAK